jgi:hypothetical protein
MFNSSTNTIFDADHGKFFRVDIDNKKFSFECEQKFEIEPEIVDKIVTLTLGHMHKPLANAFTCISKR